MKGLISLFVRRGITTSVLVLAVVAFGVYNYAILKLDLFPDITFPAIVIMTEYTGAGPEDVERLVSRPVEQAVAGVKGIKELHSYSQTGSSVVMARFVWGYDMKAAEREVQKYLDISAGALPTDAAKPLAFALDPSMMPILMLGVNGPYSPAELRKIAEDTIQPKIERVDGVASVGTSGGLVRQFNVFVNPERMRALGVSATTVVNAMRMANIQVPGGQLDDGLKAYNVQVEGQFTSTDEMKKVVLGARQGRMITVNDVAQVEDAFAEPTEVSRVNGQGAVSIVIRRQSDANTVLTARAVHRALKELKPSLPAGIEISTLSDQSEIINRSIANLSDTVWQALLITMIVLIVFLGSFRGSFVVGVTMPVSLIATFGVMGQMGITLNVISMAGLALAVGMLVDNSVVVVENVFRHFKQRTGNAAESSIRGTHEVGIAVTAATLCHLVVFAPLLFVPGIAGQLFKDLALTICMSLLISLFVALTLMPMLTSRLLGGRGLSFEATDATKRGPIKRIAAWVDGIVPVYVRILGAALQRRKTVLAGAGLLLLASIVATELWLDVDFMAEADQGLIAMTAKVQPGTTLADFDALMQRAEREIAAEVPEATAISVRFGEPGGRMSGFASLSGQSSFSGTVQVKLVSIKERARRQWEIEAALRKRLAKISGLDVDIRRQDIMSGEGDIEVRILADNLDKMRAQAAEVIRRVEKLPSIQSANSSMELGRPQLGVKLDRERLKVLGMTAAEVVGSISAYIQGTTAGVFREEGDEYDILIRSPKNLRENASLLSNLPLVSPAGKVLPLRAVAKTSEDVGAVTIRRFNQRRIAVVAVNKKSSVALGPATDEVKKALGDMTNIDIAGSAADMLESFQYLGIALVLALFLVYGVMAALFESLLEPFVILFSIPVMWIGVVAVLIPTGTSLQITAMIGLIILEGIVVNNAIVLIDYLKQLRERGMPLIEATLEAGRARLRPVLMTSCTTVLAMLPLALELGEGAEMWSPMARTVIGGLTGSTLLTLVVVPSVYVIFAGHLERRNAARELKAQAKGIKVGTTSWAPPAAPPTN